ncbi:MAG: hypothetical protein Fur0018_13600 [Anaerolineales bacterium]
MLTASISAIAPTPDEVRVFALAHLPPGEVRFVQVRPVAGHVSAALQVALPDDLSLQDAHTQAEMLERALC